MKQINQMPNKDLVSVDTKDLSSDDSLKLRIMRVKSKLPARYISVYEHYFGDQTKEQRQKVRDCIGLRDADEQITINIEKMAKEKEKRDIALASATQLAHEISNNTFKRKNIVKK